jgi:xanthine/uracil permease
MKNAPFYALVGAVAIVLGLIIIAIFLQAMQGQLPENAVGGMCLIIFLIIATIGYEMVAKPGLYSRRKPVEEPEKKEVTESAEEGGEKKPDSP